MATTGGAARLAEQLTTRRQPTLLALVALALAFVGLTAGQLSMALFTDQETVDGTFSSGSIILDATKIDALTLTTSAMMPGDSVTDDVVVENDGTAQLRYSLATATTNADLKNLRDVLTLTVKTQDATVLNGPCGNFDGTILLSATALGANGAKLGDSTAGSQAGDRTLAAGANETLCFRVTLPTSTGNAYQGASATTTFTFDGEQTANNP